MTIFEQGSIKVDNWIVTAFVTEDTPYELELATHLLPSLEKLNIPHYIEVIENKGSWLKNVAEKPATIYRALEKYPGKNLVVLDSDSEIITYPKLFNEIPEDCDIALHVLDWDKWYNNNSHVKEVLSGTLFLHNTDKVKNMVKAWYEEASKNEQWEQKCLAKIIEQQNIKIFELPLSYCYISSLPGGKEPLIKIDNPIIVHFQASRRFKKLIK